MSPAALALSTIWPSSPVWRSITPKLAYCSWPETTCIGLDRVRRTRSRPENSPALVTAISAAVEVRPPGAVARDWAEPAVVLATVAEPESMKPPFRSKSAPKLAALVDEPSPRAPGCSDWMPSRPLSSRSRVRDACRVTCLPAW